MAGRRRGHAIDGWLVIDKPAGPSSAAVVGRVRRATGAAKVGHGGTLDPLATGILPVALGEATKTVAYAMEGTKTYRLRVRWGIATATDDAEGAPVAESPTRPDEAAIRAALPAFTGEIEQVPPVFSAIKIDGRRAYDLARAEVPVDMPSRRVRIDRFDLVARPDADTAEFEVVSGKGAYMRALARDLALALGTRGHLAALRRLRVGRFGLEGAISLEKLEEVGHSAALSGFLLPVATALDDIPALALTEEEARRLAMGQALAAPPIAARTPGWAFRPDEVGCALFGGRAVALVRLAGGEIRPVRILNL